jgi:NAD(P)-dependent dehydrogenase (short-subunit alcohol dehydrogenase family)
MGHIKSRFALAQTKPPRLARRSRRERCLMSVYDLTGRKALVTGGARGLGEGMAAALAGAGAAVVIGDVREDLGKACADALQRSGASAEFVPLDVTSEGSWEQAMAQVIGHLGGLDILVNNAGIEISSLLADVVIGLTPLGRLGEVADMADAVVFLASDGARFITGAGLPVDGGMGM